MTDPLQQDAPGAQRKARRARSIRNTLLVNMTLVASASIVILAGLWVRQEYARFGLDEAVLRTRLTYQREMTIRISGSGGV